MYIIVLRCVYFHASLYVYLNSLSSFFVFLFNDTATTEIYTLSLHDALPICGMPSCTHNRRRQAGSIRMRSSGSCPLRSEEHTSELQSRENLVCRLLLEKKK